MFSSSSRRRYCVGIPAVHGKLNIDTGIVYNRTINATRIACCKLIRSTSIKQRALSKFGSLAVTHTLLPGNSFWVDLESWETTFCMWSGDHSWHGRVLWLNNSGLFFHVQTAWWRVDYDTLSYKMQSETQLLHLC